MPFPPQAACSPSNTERPLVRGVSTSSTSRPSISDTALRNAAHQWNPPSLNLSDVSPARIRDYYLGGDNSFALERAWCARATRLLPVLPRVYRDERDFLRRAIRFAKRKRDIHQFLVLGAGLPYARPVHDDVLPHPRGTVVYAEPDEHVAAHLNLLVPEWPQLAAVRGDFEEPGTILFDDAVRALLDSGNPVCLVLTGVLETIADTDDATTALQCYTERFPPGSLVIATHATVDGLDTADAADADLAERRRQLCQTYSRTAHRPPRHLRTAAELRDILADLRLVQPGITYTFAWHNPRLAGGLRPAESLCLAAVAAVRRPRTPRRAAAGGRAVGEDAR